MANNAHIATGASNASSVISPVTRQISPLLTVSAAGVTAVGIATGFISYLDRSPVRESTAPGTSAWGQHLAVAAVACALYGVARWRHGRRFGRRSGRLLLLAPLGRNAAARLTTAARQTSWRFAAAIPLLLGIGYCCWRVGEQVTAGFDPNFTANAWGGPTYLGAMACHYLDIALVIAASGWLLDKILPHPARPRPTRRQPASAGPARL
jgi:hypothetical protein